MRRNIIGLVGLGIMSAVATVQAAPPPEPHAVSKMDEPPKPAVIWAAERHEIDWLERLIAHGVDVDARDSRGRTALVYAGRPSGPHPHESARIAYLLLEAGADVDARDDAGRTPLMNSARFGHAGVSALLLVAGADPNAADQHGWTPLMHAVTCGDFLFLRRSVSEAYDEADMRDGWVTLFIMQYIVGGLSVETLLQAGADPNARSEDGWTPLTLAAMVGWYEHEREVPTETRLTREEADALRRNDEFLGVARMTCPADLVQRLLARGADPNVKGPDGRTALDIARLRRDEGGARLVAVLERFTAPAGD